MILTIVPSTIVSCTNLNASFAYPGCKYLHINQMYQIRTFRNFILGINSALKTLSRFLTHLNFSTASQIVPWIQHRGWHLWHRFNEFAEKEHKEHCILWTMGSSLGWYIKALLLHNCSVIFYKITDWINNSADVWQEDVLT